MNFLPGKCLLCALCALFAASVRVSADEVTQKNVSGSSPAGNKTNELIFRYGVRAEVTG
jgi:hypothetical protein